MGKYLDTRLVLVPDPDLFSTFPVSLDSRASNRAKTTLKSLVKKRKATLSLSSSTSAQIGCDSCPSAWASPATPWLPLPEPMWSKPGKKKKNLSPVRGKQKGFGGCTICKNYVLYTKEKTGYIGGKQELNHKEKNFQVNGCMEFFWRSSHVTQKKVLHNSSQVSYLWGCAGPAASGRSSRPVGSWGRWPENSGPRTAWCLEWSSGSPVAGSRTGWAPPTHSQSLLWWTAEPKQRHIANINHRNAAFVHHKIVGFGQRH